MVHNGTLTPQFRPDQARWIILPVNDHMVDQDSSPTRPLVRVLIVDDDVFMRDGLSLNLSGKGFEVLEAGDEATALALALGEPAPEVAVVDISIPPEAQVVRWTANNFGVRLAQRIKAERPAMGIVFLSAYEYHLDGVWDMIRAGQRGLAYKLKGRRSNALIEAINKVLEGKVEIDPEVRAKRPALIDELYRLLDPEERPWVERVLSRFPTLTPQELRTANLLAASHNTQGIAAKLGVQRADSLIGRVYAKLGLSELSTAAPHLRQSTVLVKACMIRDFETGSMT